MPSRRLRANLAWCLTLLAAVPIQHLVAQAGGRAELFAGSELESYIRAMQLAGRMPITPLGIRPLVRVVRDTSRHPWADRYAPFGDTAPQRVTVVAPMVSARWNSSFPWGDGDGATWAGRGATASISGGVELGWWRLHLRLAPTAFVSQNLGFPLGTPTREGADPLWDPQWTIFVDRPQRFGTRSYTRLDWGQSELRIHLPFLQVGAGNSHIGLGPGGPLAPLLNNNAPGFAHTWARTARPVPLGIADLSAHYFVGALEQSDWSPVSGSRRFVDGLQSGTRRAISGITLSLQPRGVDRTIELGLSRLFVSPWTSAGISGRTAFRPLETFWKRSVDPINGTDPFDPRTDADNQLASLFARFTFPKGGAEITAEFVREDHSWDLRDFLNEPESNAGWILGARQALRRRGDNVLLARLDIQNFDVQPIAQQRPQGYWYIHAPMRQGFTNRGQLLGASTGLGAPMAMVLGVDHFTTGGRRSLEWSRARRRSRVPRDEQALFPGAGFVAPNANDIAHALTAEQLWFRRTMDVTVRAGVVWNANRDFVRDRTNLHAGVSARVFAW